MDASVIISGLTAFAAVVVSPWVTNLTTKRQIRASVVSANRQQWINALRNDLSELVTALQVWGSPYYSEGYKEGDQRQTFRQILLLESRIQMMLNPNEPDHEQLLGAIAEARKAASQDPPENYHHQVHEMLRAEIDNIIRRSKQILKREWERVKKGD